MTVMNSEKQPTAPGETDHRSKPSSDAFLDFISSGWAPRPEPAAGPVAAAPYAARRRDAVSAAFPGERLVIPAGGFKVRSNDTDYRFRPHSAFAHLTGLGTDREPDAVLVLEPRDERTAAATSRSSTSGRGPSGTARSSSATRGTASSGSASDPAWRRSRPSSA